MVNTSVFNGELRGIYPEDDFHALRSSQVDLLVASAKRHGYRKPKNANGSTARMYFQALVRKWRGERRNPGSRKLIRVYKAKLGHWVTEDRDPYRTARMGKKKLAAHRAKVWRFNPKRRSKRKSRRVYRRSR